MTKPTDIATEFVVDDLEILKVIADSTRLDIVKSLKKPKTVKEIAQRLKKPATKLYYHVNLMEKHGLIQVVETNIVSGIVEKKYQVVARNYRIDNQLLADQTAVSQNLDRMLGAIFDITRTQIQRTVQLTEKNPFDESLGILWRATLRLTPEQYEEFYGRFKELIDQMAALHTDSDATEPADPEQNLYGITLAYYPVIVPQEENK